MIAEYVSELLNVPCETALCASSALPLSEKDHAGSLESHSDSRIQLHSELADPLVLQSVGLK